MIAETITYEDFDGVPQTETLYFNLTELELSEIALTLPEDITELLSNAEPKTIMSTIMEKLGMLGILNFVKQMVLKAYGIKGADGQHFVKNEKITTDFSNTMAFQNVVMRIANDEEFAKRFFEKAFPANHASVETIN